MKTRWIILLLVAFCLPAVAQKKAAPFDMETRLGEAVSLESTETPFALLYCNNPDCNICEEVSDSLSSQDVMQFVDARMLTIYSVCVAGDFDEWLNQADVPGRVEAVNKSMSIMAGEDYEFSSLPALFLIDKNRTILLNDTTVAEIVEYLEKYMDNGEFSESIF